MKKEGALCIWVKGNVSTVSMRKNKWEIFLEGKRPRGIAIQGNLWYTM